ncbi:hypothetical protein [Ammoniphilus sp. 3BR4]
MFTKRRFEPAAVDPTRKLSRGAIDISKAMDGNVGSFYTSSKLTDMD